MTGRSMPQVAAIVLISGVFLGFPAGGAVAAEDEGVEVAVYVTISPLEAPLPPAIPVGELPRTGLAYPLPLTAGVIAIVAGSVLLSRRNRSDVKRVSLEAERCSRAQ